MAKERFSTGTTELEQEYGTFTANDPVSKNVCRVYGTLEEIHYSINHTEFVTLSGAILDEIKDRLQYTEQTTDRLLSYIAFSLVINPDKFSNCYVKSKSLLYC